jgi:hypothetical protein
MNTSKMQQVSYKLCKYNLPLFQCLTNQTPTYRHKRPGGGDENKIMPYNKNASSYPILPRQRSAVSVTAFLLPEPNVPGF